VFTLLPMQICPNCGEENSERARFCSACGTSLQAAEAPREVRKTVTILFCDVTGSTALGERLDPESLRNVMTRYFDEMRAVIESHGGTVEKFIGDAVMAVFGVPVVHEDDALRAVRAAGEMRESLGRLNDDLERRWGVRIETRIGLNTGEVVAGAGDQTLVTGDAVNTAARLEQHARPGDILLGEPTYRLVRHVARAEPTDPIEAKGKAEPVTAYRLLGVAGIVASSRRLDSPLIGRAHELELAVQAFDRAVRERACHLFTVFGPPGVGKSRLTQEVISFLEARATVCRGRCLPYGRGITFWPLAEIVHDLAGLTGGESPEEAETKIAKLVEDESNARVIAGRVAALIGLGEATGQAEESFWAVRKLFESLAQRKPLVVVVDDIHWAEPTLLDLLEHIADWTRDAALLLTCLARPDLLDSRPGWAGGKMNASSILLEPLRVDESERLVANLLGGMDLPQGVLGRITESAEGNPLFVEEIVNMLIDDGLLQRQNGSWEVARDIDHVPIPATIQSLLAARLDRLTPEERRATDAAAIVGKEFWLEAVDAITGMSSRAPLMALVRKELVRPDRSRMGEEAFRFRHVLIRDAAYNAIAKQQRAQLHERFANWMEEQFADRIAEHEEIIGYHLEQAYLAKTSLGPADDAAKDLAHRAAARLAQSGLRAFDRGDDTAAVDLLTRARSLLGPEASARLIFALAAAKTWVDSEQGEAAFAEAEEAAQAEGDRVLEWRARTERIAVVLNRATDPIVEETVQIAREAIAAFEELGDVAGSAAAWNLLANCRNAVGEYSDMLHSAEKAMAFARRAGDERAEWFARQMVNAALIWGSTPADQALVRADALVTESEGSPLMLAMAWRTLAGIKGLLGDIDASRAIFRQVHDLFEELGVKRGLSGVGSISGNVELWAGDFVAAEAQFRESCDLLEELGEIGVLSTIICCLGDALIGLGRLDEAEECAKRGRELGAPDDYATQFEWRRQSARVLAHRGQTEDAERLAREAIEIVGGTEGLLWQAEGQETLSDVLKMAGRKEEARDAARKALDFYERKGNVPMTGRMRSVIASLG
jgi:predicted ATPase/class 3 adenylate cyclase